MPALPLDEAGKYVAAAYVTFVALILIYVAIMSIRLSSIEKELAELNALAAKREENDAEKEPEPAGVAK